MEAKVSVIIPTYNREDFIERSVNSVLNQSFEAFELFIVDDGSTDGTKNKVQELASADNRINYIHSENHGVSHARNLGIQASSAPYISFLDSDDEWMPQKLDLQYRKLEEHPHFLWCHGNEVWYRNGQLKKQKPKHQKAGGDQFSRSLELCCISPSTVFLSRDILNHHRWFREDFPVCEDYELWLRLSSQHQIAFIDDELTIKHAGHEDQLSFKFHSMDFWRAKAIVYLLRNQPEIPLEKKYLAKVELIKKCEILMNGFNKHGTANSDRANEVRSWLKDFKNPQSID